MKASDFYSALARSRNKFRYSRRRRDNYALRLRLKSRPKNAPCFYCPLTAVAYAETGKLFDVGQYLDAAKCLGIRLRTAHDIVAAADYPCPTHSRTRSKLLTALGITK